MIDFYNRFLNWTDPAATNLRILRRISVMLPLSIFIALLLGHFTDPVYQVKLSVAPPLEGRESKALSGLSGLGAASALLGGGFTPPSFLRFEDIVGSVRVSQLLIDKYHLDRRIFYRQWDANAGQWKAPNGIFADTVAGLKGVLGLTPWSSPDAASLAEFVKDKVAIEKNATYGTFTLTYMDRDPILARDLVMHLVQESDAILVADAKRQYGIEVDYLENKLQNITGAELRQSLITILTDAERNSMTVASSGQYAAQIVDGPVISAQPSRPKVKIFLLFAVLISFFTVGAFEAKRFVTAMIERRKLGLEGSKF